MGIVSVCKVPEYRQDLLDQAVEQHFARIHAEEIIRPGMKVLLKPNLLRGCRPEAAVTTRAELLMAICRKLKSMGVNQITVAGNFFQMMKDITAVANDLEFGFPGSSCIGAPSVVISNLAVAGK